MMLAADYPSPHWHGIAVWDVLGTVPQIAFKFPCKGPKPALGSPCPAVTGRESLEDSR